MNLRYRLLPALAFFLTAAVHSAVYGQEFSDTTRIAPRDTAVVIDSVRIRFIPGMGEILPPDSTNPFRSARFLFMDEKNVEELSWRLPGFFLRDLGESGKPSQLTAFGSDIRTIGILVDGRPMNDPVTGGYTLSNVPIEFLDHIEILEGADVLGASLMGPSAALNFVTRSYNSLRPFTKIRFVQDPKETILTDLFFSQNLSRGLNLQFGLQRQTSAGRFVNSQLDGWNVRTRLRFNFSDRFNLALTDLYTRTVNGLNNGVDAVYSIDPFDDVTALVNSTNTYEILTRRDLTLAGIGRILEDSASTTRMNLYYSSIVREYAAGISALNPTLRSDFVRARFLGVRVEQRLDLSPAALLLSAEHESRSTDATSVLPDISESRAAVSATASLTLAGTTLRASGRFDRWRSESGTSVGGSLRVVPTEWITLDADLNRAYRFPTIQERSWTDSLVLRRVVPEREQHTTARSAVTLRLDEWATITVGVLRRDVAGALTFRPDTTAFGTPAIGLYRVNRFRTDGVTASGTIRVGHFELSGEGSSLVMDEDGSRKTRVPEILMNVEFTYQNRFFDGALDMRTGIRVRYSERFRGDVFIPSALLFSEGTQYILGRATTLDLFGVLRIGSAHIAVSVDNVFNSNVLTVPVYPMPKRHLRIGVNWTFLD